MTRHYQTTADVEGHPERYPVKKQRSWPVGVMLAIGWVLLLAATNMPLLAAIQAGMLGLGAIGTAIVLVFYRN